MKISKVPNYAKDNFDYSAYVDNTTFFLKDEKSASLLTHVFNKFFQFSALQTNKSKCEIADVGILGTVKFAICVIRFVNLKESRISRNSLLL